MQDIQRLHLEQDWRPDEQQTSDALNYSSVAECNTSKTAAHAIAWGATMQRFIS